MVVVTFPNVVVTKAGTYTLVATSASGMSPVSDPFTVYTATHLKVKVTSVVPKPTAGDTVTVTVTALDAHNKPDPTYRGIVHFTSTDLQAVLPTDYTFTVGDGGQHSFDVVLKTAGVKRVAVNDMTKVKVKARVSVTVLSGRGDAIGDHQVPAEREGELRLRIHRDGPGPIRKSGDQLPGYGDDQQQWIGNDHRRRTHRRGPRDVYIHRREQGQACVQGEIRCTGDRAVADGNGSR